MGAHIPRRFRRVISLGVGGLFLLSLVDVNPGSITPVTAAAASYPPVSVFVGYADSLRANSFFPNPWNGSANVSFQGCNGACTFDGGAVRIDNPTSSSLTVQQVTVTVGSSCTFSIWPPNMSLPAGQTLILAQEGSGASSGCSQGNLFDTSDAPSISCTPDGIVPAVQVTINGITTSYSDTRQVLNTGGFDLASCPPGTNESHQWQIVGGGPTASELRGGGSPSIRHQPICQRGRFPVNCATGEFWHTFGDLFIPGRGIPLDFNRTYSSLGASQLGPLGAGWTDSYNMSLALDAQSGNVTVNEEAGSQVVFTPTPSGYQPPSRVLATLVKNSDGSYTFTRRDGEQFLFNAGGQLTQESDRNGYKTILTYSGANLATVTDPSGRTLSFTYSGAFTSKVTDSSGRQVSFTYDNNGNLVSATDVVGGVTNFTYDANHLMLSMTDPNGGTVTNAYDGNARVISQTDPMKRTTQYSYTSTGTTVTDPNGSVTVQAYQNNELTSRTVGAGTSAAATWTYGYDPNTLGITSETDPNGHTASSTYDASGNVLTVTDALNRTTTYTYDGQSDVTSITDPLGSKTTLTYDSGGNLLSVSTPLAGTSQTQSTTFSYVDSSHPGDVTSLTDPNGKGWTFAYDGNGDLASVSDPLGNRSTITFDSIGRPASVVSPRGNASGNPSAYTTTYVFDAAGEVTSVTDPLGHATVSAYDGDGNLTSVIDPTGRKESYVYDLDNELTKVTQADGSTLSNSYDANGNLTSRINGLGNATTYVYDALDRLITSTDPLKRSTTYAYDGASNLTKVTDPAGQFTNFAYDAADELTGITYSDGKTPNVSYAYDADGRRTSMSDGTGSSTYTYDSLNRLAQSKNGAGQTVAYGYDLVGRLTALTYPNGQVVNRGYDAAGRLTSVADWLGHTTSFTYDADGNPVLQNYPNSTQAAYNYDASGQLTGITNSKGGASFASFSYTRDGNAQITKETSSGLSQPSQSYSYDQLNRLIGVNSSSYGYDAADNITKLISGGTLSYDAAGELTSMAQPGRITNFSYDSRGNRLTGLSPEGTAATNTYDQADRLTGYQTTPPPAAGLIKGGDYFSLAARTDGTAWAWGYNVFGQLGNGTTTNSNVPVQVSGLVGVTAVAAGVYHGEALKSDGTVWAWGQNGFGQLGNGTTTNSSIPVQVSGLGGATAIAAGNFHNLAVQSDGTVVAWGDGAAGELGNGSTVNSSTPVAVSNLGGVTAVAAGGMPSTPGHSLALKGDGTVWAWGYNKSGQLGNGTTANSSVPVQVPGLSGVVAISANGNNSMALKNDGTVWAWGDNSAGQLGNSGAGKTSATPVQVNISGVSSISSGADFGLAVKSDGSAWGWGDDISGQLGDGGACGKSCVTPTKVGLSNVASIAGGYVHSLGVTTDGTSNGWGDNSQGELGNGSTAGSNTPVQVKNFGKVHQAPSSASYTYNGDGLRASKTVAGVTSQFTWDLSAGLPVLLNDGSASYIYGPGGAPLEQITGSGTVQYLHQDQLGDTRLLTDSSGNVAATYQYDAYGNVTAISGIASTPIGFAGYYQDAESGLSYLLARYYDPATGQFVSVDPATATTRSPYGYLDGNPLNWRDPSGLCPWCVTALIGAVGGAIGGAITGGGGYLIKVAAGQEQFSWRNFAGATVGGAVGGAVSGACYGSIVLIAFCGAAGGIAGTLVEHWIDGTPTTASDLIWAAGTGAVGGVIGAKVAGKFFKLRGPKPRLFKNIFNPGKNARRLYGQAFIGAGVGFPIGLGFDTVRKWLPQPIGTNPRPWRWQLTAGHSQLSVGGSSGRGGGLAPSAC